MSTYKVMMMIPPQGDEKKQNLERAMQFSWEDLCNGLGSVPSGMGV